MERETARAFKLGIGLAILAIALVTLVNIACGGATNKHTNTSNSGGGIGLIYTMDHGIGLGWSLD